MNFSNHRNRPLQVVPFLQASKASRSLETGWGLLGQVWRILLGLLSLLRKRGGVEFPKNFPEIKTMVIIKNENPPRINTTHNNKITKNYP